MEFGFGSPVLLRTTKLAKSTSKIAILHQFLTIELHFVRKGCRGHFKIAILPQFLTIEPHFVRKGCARPLKIAILPQFLTFDVLSCARVATKFENRNFTSVLVDVHFVQKGWNRHLKIAILLQFLTFDVHFVRNDCAGHLKIAILPEFLTFDVHFLRKGLQLTPQNRNLTSVFDARRPFRAKGLRFMAIRRPRPRLMRERKKSERETYSEKEKRSADM